MASEATFTKTSGTITGYSSDQSNGGHTVWVSENRYKETTAGPGVNLSYSNGKGLPGDWIIKRVMLMLILKWLVMVIIGGFFVLPYQDCKFRGKTVVSKKIR